MRKQTSLFPLPRRILRASAVLIALFFPATLYLFLRAFGKNAFEAPIYYQNGVPAEAACACEDLNVPHRLWHAGENAPKWRNAEAQLHLIGYRAENALESLNLPEGISLQMYAITTEKRPSFSSKWRILYRSPLEFERLVQCTLLIPYGIRDPDARDAWTALVDHKGRIRSYANPLTRQGKRQIQAELRLLSPQK